MSAIEVNGRRYGPIAAPLSNRRATGLDGRRLRNFDLFDIALNHLEGER